jgi:ribosomal-protein-alanine N-acetyltransferase
MHEVLLETERLTLKSVTPYMINECFRKKQKTEIMEIFAADETAYAKLLTMNEKGMETFNLSLLYFLLVNKLNKEIIGECGFHSWNINHHKAEAFYLMKKDEHKKNGYMTEAIPFVLKYGFTQMNLHRIDAKIASWNIASTKLIVKNGFQKEGTLREDYFFNGEHQDSDCYSLLKHEWEKRKI